jgi:LmbE family N-acetylglucosaminyl deacetylase
MWGNQSDTWIDVTATADRKIEALRCHASQLHDPEAVFERVRGRLAEGGKRIGTAAAEGYRLVVLDQDPEEAGEAEVPAGNRPKGRG